MHASGGYLAVGWGAGGLAAVLAVAGCGGSGAVPEPQALTGEAACAAVKDFSSAEHKGVITSATWVPAATEKSAPTAATFLPAHCVVQGSLEPRTGVDGKRYATKFELRLPLEWNRRFFFQGGSGLEGTLGPAYGPTGGAKTALEQGFAVVSQNGGHDNADLPAPEAFGFDPQARVDFGYGAIIKTSKAAKSLIADYYGDAIERSYFDGCSTGGRQGMAFAQRFPDEFDGIVAGAPVFDFGRVVAARIWGWQKAAAVVSRDINGMPRFHEAMPQADRQLFQRELLAACDAQDGAVDGMISNVAACTFRPKALLCTGEKTPECLSAEQVGIWEAVLDGPVDSGGAAFKVPGYRAPGEVPVRGYRIDAAWMTSSGQAARITGQGPILDIQWKLNIDPTPILFMTPPQPGFRPLDDVDWDTWGNSMTVNAPWLMSDPDLGRYRDRGGKMIFYHGTGDSGPNAVDTIDYYESVVALNSSREQTGRFARLFLVPGMGHCRGGPSTDSFDRLAPIMDWVERGKAPDVIVAQATPGNADLAAVTPAIPASRTRPLCPYPAYPRYKGTGSIDDAASFTCTLPVADPA